MDRNLGQSINVPIHQGGQARKSLWIETTPSYCAAQVFSVRLVRACGSKPTTKAIAAAIASGQARKSLWIETKQAKKQTPLAYRSGS